MKIFLLTAALFFTGLLSLHAQSALEPARLFSDNMVLQRNMPVPVWGWVDGRQRVTVIFNGQEYKARSDRSTGKWQVTLPPMPAGGPFQMTISSKKENITLNNILIGDVWICSGQSNMEWPVSASNNAAQEIASASDTRIRHFNVPRRIATAPVARLEGGEWEIASPETVADFTAVGYFFARELRKHTDVPIGLLNTTWGGTNVQTWTSVPAIGTIEEYAGTAEVLSAFNLDTWKEDTMRRLLKQIGEIDNTENGMVNSKAVWAQTDLDDADWSTASVPGLWESNGLPAMDGIVWYRKTLELDNASAGEAAQLHLGAIDDVDNTFVNGIQVGTTEQYDASRVYEIPDGVLQEGTNTIAVRVYDSGGGGGFHGQPSEMFLEAGGRKIPLAGTWKVKVDVVNVKAAMSPNTHPALLYNGMVEAIIPYASKGAIWYQGESNANQAWQYRELFPLMIKDWRQRWGYQLPFLFVQLANFMEVGEEPGESTWAELREAQTMALDLPKTGMAVIIDIGDANDIHPRNKQDVGHRLALQARKVAYGEEGLVYASPMFAGMEKEGDKIIINFEHNGEGLVVKDRYGYVNGFAVAGSDRKFHWAKAELRGNNQVVVHAEGVESPVAVRYGWADNPHDLNLFNSAGLPANPFRTDDWPGVTQPK